jgi:hypothetical protein
MSSAHVHGHCLWFGSKWTMNGYTATTAIVENDYTVIYELMTDKKQLYRLNLWSYLLLWRVKKLYIGIAWSMIGHPFC